MTGEFFRCHCEERWRRGNLLKSAPIKGLAASLSLLAMTTGRNDDWGNDNLKRAAPQRSS
jgi:hypothetical protein